MTQPEDLATNERSGTTRRSVLAASLGGAAVLGGATGALAGRGVSRGGWRRQEVRLEVACLGQTWRNSASINPADDADFRVPFAVEGWIYELGTVRDGFVPSNEGQIGRWFCQGWQVLDGERPEPHAVTRQTFVFGTITQDALFPNDMLCTTGIEGTFDDSQTAVRPVIGGTGKYLASLGECRQTGVGENTTVFADGSGLAAPNFTMVFDLIQPDI